MAAGIADEGFIPFIYSIANFPTFRNLEQIRNDIAYPGKHVVVTSVGAGLSYGTLGFSHFGVFLCRLVVPVVFEVYVVGGVDVKSGEMTAVTGEVCWNLGDFDAIFVIFEVNLGF